MTDLISPSPSRDKLAYKFSCPTWAETELAEP